MKVKFILFINIVFYLGYVHSLLTKDEVLKLKDKNSL